MPLSYLDYIQPKSRLAIWAWSPVIVLRISLMVTYVLFAISGFVALLAGVPVFNQNEHTPDGYTHTWAIALVVTATLSAIGSVADKWQELERWATLALSSLLLTYIGGLAISGFIEHDYARQFVAIIALIAGVLPIGRFIYLAAQSGKRKNVSTNVGGK